MADFNLTRYQRIVLLIGGALFATVFLLTVFAGTAFAGQNECEHTVRPGNTLAGIAASNGFNHWRDLHDLNPQDYLQEVLRLAPHWKKSRVVELAPKHWRQTRERLSEPQRQIITPPWARSWPTVSATAPPGSAAA